MSTCRLSSSSSLALSGNKGFSPSDPLRSQLGERPGLGLWVTRNKAPIAPGGHRMSETSWQLNIGSTWCAECARASWCHHHPPGGEGRKEGPKNGHL